MKTDTENESCIGNLPRHHGLPYIQSVYSPFSRRQKISPEAICKEPNCQPGDTLKVQQKEAPFRFLSAKKQVNIRIYR